MKIYRQLPLSIIAAIAVVQSAPAQTWTPVKNVPNIGAGAPILMLDGTVLIHDADAIDWYKLSPDIKGSYANGTWTKLASSASNYGPLYYASQVLNDGRIVVIGGEYNLSNTATWSNLGEIYDPYTNVWSKLNAPTGWSQVGDAQSIIFPNGTLMLAYINNSGADAILNATTLAWNEVGTGKADGNDEEGWTLLPDGSVLTVDVGDEPAAERFVPSLGTSGEWISAGNLIHNIVDVTDGEVGPAVLGYDGKVYAMGGNGYNAIYTPPATESATGTWVQGPDFPVEPTSRRPYDMADAPMCILPNGQMLAFASPGYGKTPAQFFLYNTTAKTLTKVAGTANTPTDSSYYGNMLLLPSGQVLFCDNSNDIELYTPAGAPQNAWRPTLNQFAGTYLQGQTYTITGTQFNGLSGGSAYGDDFQNATNYPMVRFTNLASGDVTYCRMTGFSTRGVATGSANVSATFLVPASTPTGPSTIEVVANGIPSAKANVTIGTNGPISAFSVSPTSVVGGANSDGIVDLKTAAGASGVTVTITSSSPDVTVQPALRILSGKTFGSFPIKTKTVTTSTKVTITVTDGTSTIEQNLTLTPSTT